jgi:glycosyltransferase involved in cell wall biosynthesis
MKIVCFSMTPLYPDRVMGGAQKQLYAVVMHLAGLGHEVTVVCTRRPPDVDAPFLWHTNAEVIPVFRFKQPYPEPYATPIYNIANAINDLAAHLAEADVFYSHDGGFIFPYVYQNVPTVVSLRSVIFSETLQSAYLFQGDDLILISNFQRDTILATVGRFFPSLSERTHVIYNGLDFDKYHPVDAHEVLRYLPGVDPEQHAIALFPHRPEAPKGIFEVIAVARRLVNDYGIANLRVLVPRWISEALSPDDKAFYNGLTTRIDEYGLTEHFVFHEWIPQSLMPQLYSLGSVTFAIGRYVETFGNVPYESLACGTPAIVARVGPAREILPDHLIDKIDPGDVAAAARIAARVIQNGERAKTQTVMDLRARFDVKDMVAAYANVILKATKREPMPYVPRSHASELRYDLAPWVMQAGDGRLYHDFTGEYRESSQIASSEGVADGWLVPIYDEEGGA